LIGIVHFFVMFWALVQTLLLANNQRHAPTLTGFISWPPF
jgi:hypothetical protein